MIFANVHSDSLCERVAVVNLLVSDFSDHSACSAHSSKSLNFSLTTTPSTCLFYVNLVLLYTFRGRCIFAELQKIFCRHNLRLRVQIFCLAGQCLSEVGQVYWLTEPIQSVIFSLLQVIKHFATPNSLAVSTLPTSPQFLFITGNSISFPNWHKLAPSCEQVVLL